MAFQFKRGKEAYLSASSLLNGLERLEETLLGEVEGLSTLSDGHEVVDLRSVLGRDLLLLLGLLRGDLLGTLGRNDVSRGVRLGILNASTTHMYT
jgi:hypothetical protein